MAGNAWGESWGIAGSFAWGDSWGFEGFVPPSPPPPPPPVVTDAGGVGRQAWSAWYRSTLPKKKRQLADELDEMIAELRERIVESPTADEGDYERELRVSQALAASDELARVSNTRIKAQIDLLRRAIEEIDDEEIILLALH